MTPVLEPPLQPSLLLSIGAADPETVLTLLENQADPEAPLALLGRSLLAWARQTDDLDLTATAEAMAAVARLAAVRSAHLLAQPVEAEDGDEVEERFHDYQQIREAAIELRAFEGRETFPGSGRNDGLEPVLVPRSSSTLLRAWNDMEKRARGKIVRLPVPSFVPLEVAMNDLTRRLRRRMRLSFGRLLGGASRHQAVAHFIAVLELARQRKARVIQGDLFGEITLEATDRGVKESRAG